MDLSHNIEELLFCNDCVIIPTIGGFIAQYSPATIDPIEQQVFPPKKTISFNSKLVNNDGLLANKIVQEEDLTYEEASEKVLNYSQQIESELFNNKIVHFSNIGKLYFNADSKLEFVPENNNFLRDAYGLPDMDCTPVLRNRDMLTKSLNAEKDLNPQKLKSTGKSKPIINIPRVAAASILLILAFSSPYFYNLFFPAGQTNTEITGVEDMADSNKTSNASILPTPTITEGNTSDEKVVKEEENELAEDIEAENESPAVREEKEEEKEPVAVSDDNAEKYVIVLGAFGKKKNADRLAKKLAKDNYLPDVTLKNGLNRVGVQITCTQEELKSHLTFLKVNYNKKAWLVE